MQTTKLESITMPRNLEYLIAAYGIVGSVVAIYALYISFKLKSVKKKLQTLQNSIANET